MTAIQESNYKRINTHQLFEEFKVYEENLSLNSGNLKLKRDYVYNQVNDVFEDIIITDISIDRCGSLYLVDQAQRVDEHEKKELKNDGKQKQEQDLYIFHANEKVLRKIGSTEKTFPLALNTISAIGVDKDTIYIADCVSENVNDQSRKDDGRLIALTKTDLKTRWILSKDPEGRSLNKIHTIQCDNRGKIYILEGSEKRVLYLNTCETCYPIFHALDFGDSGHESNNVDFLPKSLVVGVDDILYILYSNAKNSEYTGSGTEGYILKVRLTKAEKSVETIKVQIDNFSPSGIAVDNINQIFICGPKSNGQLEIYKFSNDSAGIWIQLIIHMLPNEKTERGCQKLISDPKGKLYILSQNELTLLDSKELNLQNSEGHFEGTYISKPIDSQALNTHWHRLLLEGEFEKGTQVDFLYYVSDFKLSDDEIKNLDFKEWHNCVSKTSSIQGNKKRDALFIDNTEGRYLWFKIILSGNEMLSPVIKSITVLFPRISYLKYLPGIYQEDPVSKGLLERFLAIFESIFYEIDFTIDHIGRYFDALGAPPEFLSWLGSWLDVSMDEDWPEDKKRLFIKNAISLYKKRGTRECLEESIKLFTGKKPFVVESFQAFKECTGTAQPCSNDKTVSSSANERIFFPPKDILVNECLAKNNTEEKSKEKPLIDKLYGTERFGIYVLLADLELDATAKNRIMRIIDEQKPAHISCELKVLEPWFYLDKHTYLGINTVITEPKFILEKTSVIGRDTVLHDEEKAGQIERHSRVGIDILLS
ncbi:MAG: hypothetical protein QG646_4656 [Euryarchaeota archaeon]|nr:hypothetical protein [Euryarchaeota archaeon]